MSQHTRTHPQADADRVIMKLDPDRCLTQTQSPLFSTIPAEIRDLIFHFALLSDENPDRKYDPQTCYVRPGYTCRRHTHTALLRTCQLIYRETWFRPWASAEHTLFFTAHDRRPRYVTTTRNIAAQLAILALAGVQTEVDHVRIFAQLYLLEDGTNLQEAMNIEHFQPKCVTICLRHTDWWFWETDEPLRIDALWVRECRFPDSVTRVRMELETLQRKKHQMDSIVAQMREQWFFRRQDGTVLTVQTEPAIMNWTGSSIWNGERWVHDEARPMELDFHVTSISWLPLPMSMVEQKHEPAAPNLRAINPGIKIQGNAMAWPPRTRQQQSDLPGHVFTDSTRDGEVDADEDENDDDEDYDEDFESDEDDVSEMEEQGEEDMGSSAGIRSNEPLTHSLLAEIWRNHIILDTTTGALTAAENQGQHESE